MAAFAWQRLLAGRLDTSRDELETTVRQLLRDVLNARSS